MAATETVTTDYLQAVMGALPTGVVVVGADDRIECVNPAATRILGVEAQELMNGSGAGLVCRSIIDAAGRDIGDDSYSIARTIRAGRRTDGRILGLARPDGSRVWLSASWCLLDESNQRSPLLLSFTDITAERTASEQLAYQANHDSLTGLPNRARVLQHISDALCAEGDDGLRAVLFIDLDNFKTINDTLGHEAGDSALKVVAQRLCHALRADDMVGRLGGDEFVAVLTGVVTPAELGRLSARLHRVLAQPVLLAGVPVRLGASVGIAEVSHDDPRDASQILREADAAMYRAKVAGRGLAISA